MRADNQHYGCSTPGGWPITTAMNSRRCRLLSALLLPICSALFLALSLSGTAHAAKVAVVNLAGTDFGHNNGVDVNSSPTTLDAQTRYYYRIEGTVAGTGPLAFVIPSGTNIADLLEDIEPGSSSQLVGFYDNPGGTLPFTYINRTYNGVVSTPAGNVNASLNLIGSVNAGGIVRFQVTNVSLTLGGNPVAGTIVFENGSKATIGIPPKLQFSAATASVAENGGSVVLTVQRTENASGAHAVSFATANGTAQAGTHYTAASGMLNFGDGVTSRTITVNITNNAAPNADRTFTVALSAPTLGAELGTPATITVTIVDDDTAGPAGEFSFTSATASYGEGDGTVQVTVQRTNGSSGLARVRVVRANAPGGHPDASSSDVRLLGNGLLTFNDGVTTQTIGVEIKDDALFEGAEDFLLKLVQPTGGASIGTPGEQVVTITDNDPVPPFINAGFTGLGGGMAYGFIHFNTTTTGQITGAIFRDGANYPFKGKLAADGTFVRTFKSQAAGLNGAPGLTLNLTVAPDNNTFAGMFDGLPLSGERDKAGTSAAPVPEAGAFTALLGVNDLTPGGGPLAGFLTLKVGATGTAKFKGALPDGAKLKGASHVSITGKLPIVTGLYKKKAGFLRGTTLFTQADLLRWTGALEWTKPPGSKGLYGADGLTGIATALAGVPYVKPAPDTFVLADLNAENGEATVTLAQGNLAAPLNIIVTVNTKNKVAVDNPGADQLACKLILKKGLFNGSFMDGGLKRKFQGALLQDSPGMQLGAGFFLGTDVAGSVIFNPKD